jgi:O-antigen ligase
MEFGEISIRMVMFIAAFIVTMPFVIKNIKMLIQNTLVKVLIIFCFFLCFSVAYGWARGNHLEFILMDLKSFLFLLIIPGYFVIINNEHRIGTIIKCASYASAVLAIITIALHFILRYISKENETVLNTIINNMELGGLFDFGDGIYRVYFRSSVCFIIPFLYGLNSLIEKNGSNKQVMPYILMTVSLTAIVLTYTRSIWLGFAVAVILYMVIKIKKYKVILKGMGIVIAGFAVFIMISWLCYGFEGVVSNAVTRVVINQQSILEEDFDEMRFEQLEIQIESNKTREERLHAVYLQIEKNWILGCGLGKQLDVNGFPCKIEYTYLDILGKMGVLGFISFCLLMFWPVCLVFKKDVRIKSGYMVVVTCTLVGILVSSVFNPYITSPIGLSVYALLGAIVFQNESEVFGRSLHSAEGICYSNNTSANSQM